MNVVHMQTENKIVNQTKKRYEIFKNFKKYVQQKDNRKMDSICISETNEFQLQAQQQFLREYMNTYKSWKNMLLYHQIGSGKTCTAITMAQEYLRLYPNNKVKVILPARLKTNFFDELISPCGFDAYISKDDFELFHKQSTSLILKRKIKKRFMDAIEKNYDIISFERFKISALKNSNNLMNWINEFTKDSMLIVDEVHNLLADKYDSKGYDEIVTTGKIAKRIKGMNTILFKLVNKFADPSCKMIFLTATPIFDNIGQLKELVNVMTPEAIIPKGAKISDIIDFLRGKVSYFPGTSINAYPIVKRETNNITMSATQEKVLENLENGKGEDGDNEQKEEAFMSIQRQISIACLPNNINIKGNVDKVIKNLHEYSPKVEKLLANINNSVGKHIVYSNFIQTSVNVVEHALIKNGWINIMKVVNNQTLWDSHKNKVYAIWDGRAKDNEKQLIKSIVNSKNNLFGENIRIVIGSPSIKEGVSFKHIQHIHLLDPVWNQSALTQVEGRAIRFCSHIDIDENIHKPLKRAVTVHIYKLIPIKNSNITETADQVIYDEIIPRKHKLIIAGESSLKKVAIDHYLFRNLYSVKKLKNPKSPINSAQSNIGLTEEENIFLKQTNPKKSKNTCPKARRPDEITELCKENYYSKKNGHNDLCCYKNKKVKTINKKNENKIEKDKDKKKITTCPKARIPINGICPDNLILKSNKSGIDCCYKKNKKT